jgi:hypothetical protein
MLVGLCSSPAQLVQSSVTPGSETNVKPLLLEKNEGELRTRRIHTDASTPASSQFMLKVSPKNNGSQHLVGERSMLPRGRPYRSIGTWLKTKSY